jgi:hypothetical protein
MAIERTDLSGSLSPEPASPVAATPRVQGQAAPDGGQGKTRRREPPAEELEEENETQEPEEEDSDPSPHRVDRLA